MVHRTQDAVSVNRAVERQMGKLGEGFNSARWLQNPENIALMSGNDVALFEGCAPGIFECHWVFTSRGKAALEKARLVIRKMFSNHGAEKIWGFTPEHHKAARIFNRKLCREIGGGSKGMFNTDNGWQELFILEKSDWKQV